MTGKTYTVTVGSGGAGGNQASAGVGGDGTNTKLVNATDVITLADLNGGQGAQGAGLGGNGGTLATGTNGVTGGAGGNQSGYAGGNAANGAGGGGGGGDSLSSGGNGGTGSYGSGGTGGSPGNAGQGNGATGPRGGGGQVNGADQGGGGGGGAGRAFSEIGSSTGRGGGGGGAAGNSDGGAVWANGGAGSNGSAVLVSLSPQVTVSQATAARVVKAVIRSRATTQATSVVRSSVKNTQPTILTAAQAQSVRLARTVLKNVLPGQPTSVAWSRTLSANPKTVLFRQAQAVALSAMVVPGRNNILSDAREPVTFVEVNPSVVPSGFSVFAATEAITAEVVATAVNNYTGCVGFKFTALSDIMITALGRWKIAGNSQAHALRLMEENSAGALTTLTSVSVDLSGGAAGDYVYADLPTAVQLSAGHTYHVYSSETNGGDQYYSGATVTGDPVIMQGVSAVTSLTCGASTYTSTGVGADHNLGPLSFKWAHTLSVSFSRFVGTDVIPGGVYRSVTGVRVNATDLAQGASSTLAAGQWYYDESAEVLYVRTSNGGTPDAATAVQVFVRMYFASTGIVLDNGIYYWPWLTGSVGTLTDDAPDALYGGMITAAGDIQLSNAHKFFNAVFATDGPWRWLNKTVTVLLGGRVDGVAISRSLCRVISTALVDGVSTSEEMATIRQKPVTRQARKLVPPNVFSSDSYEHLGPNVEGRAIPIGYGRAVLKAYLTDDRDITVSGVHRYGIYTYADSTVQTCFALNGVVAIRRTDGELTRVALVENTDYTKNLTACTLTIINATYVPQDYEIEVDVTGVPDGVGGYIKTFPTITADLLKRFLGTPSASIDTTQAASETRELSVWVLDRQRSLDSIFSSTLKEPSLTRSVNGSIQQAADGDWLVRAYSATFDPLAGVRLDRSELVQFDGRSDAQGIYWKVNVFYNQNFSTGAFPVQSSTSSQARYEHETEDEANVYTFLLNASDALNIAVQNMAIFGAPRVQYQFKERGAKTVGVRSSDLVQVTYDPASSATGAFASETFRVQRLEKALGPVPVFSGRLRRVATSTVVDPAALIPIIRWTGTSSGRQDMRTVTSLPFEHGTYVITADCNMTLLLRAVAGGAGGGGGSYDGNGNPGYSAGGGGGGAANTVGETVVLQQGFTYELVVGSGGSGGVGALSNAGADGGDGGDTTFGVQGGTKYVHLTGGAHGRHPLNGGAGIAAPGGSSLVGAHGTSGGTGAAGVTSGNGSAGGGAATPGGGGSGGASNGAPNAGGTGGTGGNTGSAGEAGNYNSTEGESYGGRGGNGAGVAVTGATGTYGGGGGGAGNVSGVSAPATATGRSGQNGVAVFSLVSAP